MMLPVNANTKLANIKPVTPALPIKSQAQPLHRDASQITVRHGSLDDWEALSQLLAEPEAVHFLSCLPYPNLESLRDRLTQPNSHGCLLVACCHQTLVGIVIFSLSTDPRRRHAAMVQTLWVSSAWRGKGVGSRLLQAVLEISDRWCNIHRLELHVFSDNQPAISLYKKFGFEKEGTLRAYVFRDGNYADVDVMARLR